MEKDSLDQGFTLLLTELTYELIRSKRLFILTVVIGLMLFSSYFIIHSLSFSPKDQSSSYQC